MKQLLMLAIVVAMPICLGQSVLGKELTGYGRNKCIQVQPQIRANINAGKCPGWVPIDQCMDWNGMARSELELFDILCAREKIDSIHFDNKTKTLTTIINRHSVFVEYIQKDMKFIESAVLDGSGVVHIKYVDKFTPVLKFVDKARWFGYGTGFGIILAYAGYILIVLL